jgi:hypothetical protein
MQGNSTVALNGQFTSTNQIIVRFVNGANVYNVTGTFVSATQITVITPVFGSTGLVNVNVSLNNGYDFTSRVLFTVYSTLSAGVRHV